MKRCVKIEPFKNSSVQALVFSSGKRITVYGGIVGIGPDLRLYEGYDDDMSDNLTPDEKIELAEYVIGLWQEYKANATKNAD